MKRVGKIHQPRQVRWSAEVEGEAQRERLVRLQGKDAYFTGLYIRDYTCY